MLSRNSLHTCEFPEAARYSAHSVVVAVAQGTRAGSAGFFVDFGEGASQVRGQQIVRVQREGILETVFFDMRNHSVAST